MLLELKDHKKKNLSMEEKGIRGKLIWASETRVGDIPIVRLHITDAECDENHSDLEKVR